MLLVSFTEMILNPIVICAIILAAFGIAVSLLASKITKVVRKTTEVNPEDKLLLGLKIAGLLLIVLGFVFLFIWGLGGLK